MRRRGQEGNLERENVRKDRFRFTCLERRREATCDSIKVAFTEKFLANQKEGDFLKETVAKMKLFR